MLICALITFGIIYILLSLWANSFKAKLKNQKAWFIKDGWLLGGRFAWPISWKGHLFFLTFFSLLSIFVYKINLSADHTILEPQFYIPLFFISLISYFFVMEKAEGYLFENDKWFNSLTNKIIPTEKIHNREEFPSSDNK